MTSPCLLSSSKKGISYETEQIQIRVYNRLNPGEQNPVIFLKTLPAFQHATNARSH